MLAFPPIEGQEVRKRTRGAETTLEKGVGYIQEEKDEYLRKEDMTLHLLEWSSTFLSSSLNFHRIWTFL